MICFAGLATDPASKPSMRFPLLLAAIFLSVVTVGSPAQEQRVVAQVDSDQDGMSDALEQALLVQFRPTFMVGQQDCSSIPPSFAPASMKPEPETDERHDLWSGVSFEDCRWRVADRGDPLLPPVEKGLRGSWPSAGYGACFGARARIRQPSRYRNMEGVVLVLCSAREHRLRCKPDRSRLHTARRRPWRRGLDISR